MGGWWAAKVRRFWRYLTGRVRATERVALAGWLTPAQVKLFDAMQRADQRHGLDVAASLRAAGHDQPELLLAGLLHDCGKGRQLRIWHRIGWSLSERYGRPIERLATRVPGFGPAFKTIAKHADRSAELVRAAGASERVAELIRHQAEPIDDELGHALLLADQAN